jgi:hypothetical protein
MARHQVLILGPDARELLLHEAPDGWRLPALEAEPYARGEVAPLLKAVRERLGVEAALLLCLRADPDAPAQLHLLQACVTPGALPPDARWVPLEQVPERVLAQDPGEAWRGAVAQGIDWARPGWREAAVAWAQDQLQRRGLGGALRCEQLRAWEFSCLLSLRSAAGAWYLKCVPPTFAREVKLLPLLAAADPSRLPRVVAASEPARAVLMEECPGSPLFDLEDPHAWRSAVDQYARLQIRWAERTDELMAAGCPDRPLDRLAEDVGRLLADDEALMIGEEDGLTAEEVRTLRAREGELRRRCEALARFGVPASLEHGDLWEANIIVGPGGPVFLDWTDASIAHPFFSLYPLLAAGGAEEENDGDVRGAYLEPWRERLPGVPLEEAFEEAQVPAALHHAVNYHRFILPMTRTERGARALLPFYLRALLSAGG